MAALSCKPSSLILHKDKVVRQLFPSFLQKVVLDFNLKEDIVLSSVSSAVTLKRGLTLLGRGLHDSYVPFSDGCFFRGPFFVCSQMVQIEAWHFAISFGRRLCRHMPLRGGSLASLLQSSPSG